MWILPKQLHTSAYVPDTAALNLDLQESSQLCAQSLFVRSKPSPLRTWLQKWKRDSWTQHLFGRILRPSHGKSFEIRWTFFLEVTHASHSAQPESDLEQTTQDIFGPTSQAAFDFFDQSSAFLKTSKGTSALDSEKSLENWKALVTKRRGEYSARLKLARLTSESESSSWPSPVASEVRQGFQDRSRGMKGSQESLTTVVLKDGLAAQGNHSTHGSRPEWWGTPAANDGNKTPHCEINSKQAGLVRSVGREEAKAWATPRAGCPGSQAPGTGGKVLEEQVKEPKAWATHRCSMAQDKQEDSGRHRLGEQAQHNTGGKLNSRWVETLMNLPVGWTMPSCASPVTIAPTSCASLETE